MTQPTGVFVRLPLSEEAQELLVDAAAFGKSDDSHDQAILSIGKPVTGNELYPIGYISEDAIGGLATGIYKSASISRDEDKEHHDTVVLVRLESAQAAITELEVEVMRKDARIVELEEELSGFRAGMSVLIAKEVAAIIRNQGAAP